jgi:FeS assembly SUF system protein
VSEEDYKYPKSVKSLGVLGRQEEVGKGEVGKEEKPKAVVERKLTELERKLVEGKVIAAIRTVFDPEIPVNIHDLGLIYKIDVREDATVRVEMTLTAPGCPVAGSLPMDVQRKIGGVPEVMDAEVVLVWDPPWDKSRMSEEAQLMLGF